MPGRRRPWATAWATCSSRWKRIVLGIEFCQPFLNSGRPRFGFQFGNQLVFVGNVLLNLVLMTPIIRQGVVDLKHREMRMLGNHLRRGHSHTLDPRVDVLDLDARASNARLSAADPRSLHDGIRKALDMLGCSREWCRHTVDYTCS